MDSMMWPEMESGCGVTAPQLTTPIGRAEVVTMAEEVDRKTTEATGKVLKTENGVTEQQVGM